MFFNDLPEFRFSVIEHRREMRMACRKDYFDIPQFSPQFSFDILSKPGTNVQGIQTDEQNDR